LHRPHSKRLIAIFFAPAFDRRRQAGSDFSAHVGDLGGDLGWWAPLHGSAQRHNLVRVVSNQLQVDDSVENSSDQPGVACYRRLQRDEIQALIANEPMLMIGFRFEFAGSFGRTGIGVDNRLDCLGEKRYGCLPHLDKVLSNSLQFADIACS